MLVFLLKIWLLKVDAPHKKQTFLIRFLSNFYKNIENGNTWKSKLKIILKTIVCCFKRTFYDYYRRNWIGIIWKNKINYTALLYFTKNRKKEFLDMVSNRNFLQWNSMVFCVEWILYNSRYFKLKRKFLRTDFGSFIFRYKWSLIKKTRL